MKTLPLYYTKLRLHGYVLYCVDTKCRILEYSYLWGKIVVCPFGNQLILVIYMKILNQVYHFFLKFCHKILRLCWSNHLSKVELYGADFVQLLCGWEENNAASSIVWGRSDEDNGRNWRSVEQRWWPPLKRSLSLGVLMHQHSNLETRLKVHRFTHSEQIVYYSLITRYDIAECSEM